MSKPLKMYTKYNVQQLYSSVCRFFNNL